MINNSSTLIHCICERFSAKKDVAAAFVWLHYRLEEGQECSTQKINSYFEQANLPKYNVTYLTSNPQLSSSASFLRLNVLSSLN